jgi:hypothetical protein
MAEIDEDDSNYARLSLAMIGKLCLSRA